MRWLILPLLTACSTLPDTVLLKGEVREAIDDESGPFGGASLKALDEGGKPMSKGTANGQGKFSLELPAGTTFHLIVDGEGHVPASFTGISGLDKTFEVGEGVLYGVSDAEWDGVTTAYAGCPGVGEGGAVIGEPLVEELFDENGQHPGVAAGVAELWNPDTDEVIPACYLDAETGLWDPDAAATGAAGVFGIFGVPEGTYVLSLGFEAFPDAWTWEDTLVYVPEGGVAPRFPAWVHFPVR